MPGKYVMHWNGFDLSKIRRTAVSVSREMTASPATVTVSEPYGFQSLDPADYDFANQPRPILDEFGQYTGATWDGKVGNSKELRQLGTQDKETL